MTIRAAAAAALLILAGCSKPAGGDAQDKFAGLDQQILKWKTDIVASDPLCHSQAPDQKCQGFAVACKAERDLTPADRSRGVTARVVAAITWNGFDAKLKQPQDGVRAAEFARGAAGWSRADHKPVNMESCADT